MAAGTRPKIGSGAKHVPLSVAARKGDYDRLWQKFRLVILADEPLCRFCREAGRITAADEVDHIRPIAEDPSRRLDPGNCRALCHACHCRRTADYERGRRY